MKVQKVEREEERRVKAEHRRRNEELRQARRFKLEVQGK